jgi:serine/threonine protein kinase/Tol biopolymer transport system component
MSDPVTRLNAALEGRYRIESELGEGGMATVYLADDLKHERKVALKVLKPELAAVVGAERFLAEIKTTANLQHPHILPLFDSGEADTFLFYVMPYVDGETLRERIERDKQLPVDEALGIATAVANALHTAHEAGVVHRDIKPGNILLSRGEPLVADFGIALAVGAAGGNRLTETGLSVGTPYYMSPEQATGDQMIGPASDTYALACVLYEMLIGEPPYLGNTAQAVLGKIIQGVPISPTAIRKSVPANVDAAIRKALEKLPADRFTGAHDFARALADPTFRHGENAVAASAASSGHWKWATAAMTAVAGIAAAMAVFSGGGPAPELTVERFASPFSSGQEPERVDRLSFTLSPDGSFLVYAGPAENNGNLQLWVRRWDDLQSEPLRSGGDPGVHPRVSPDGTEVVFRTSVAGGVSVAALAGGPVRPLAPVPARDPQWGLDGYIYLVNSTGSARVLATGGPIEQITDLAEGEITHSFSGFIPDTDWALVGVQLGPNDWEVRALDLDTREMKRLVSGRDARYALSGHLVFLSNDNTLMAAVLDPASANILGPEVALLDGVAAFSISDTGKLFYSTGAAGGALEFVWVTREGAVTPVDPGWSFDSGGGNQGWSLSPDGTRLAVREQTPSGLDIWIKELDDGPRFRLTLSDGEEMKPRWSPDSETVLYLEGDAASGDYDVWTRRADGTGRAELLFDDDRVIAEALLSPDGEWLVLRAGEASTAAGTRDIYALNVGDSVAVPILSQPQDETSPTLSPDGSWLAYISNEGGPYEAYLRPFPEVEDRRIQVSIDGGFMPTWSHSGRELFYVNGSRDFVAAEIDPASGRVLNRETLFQYPEGAPRPAVSILVWPAPGDQRFLMARPFQGDSVEDAAEFVLVNNFFEELRQRVPN